MTTLTMTKDQIREKIGKKWWLDNQQLIAAKLDYVSGINVFDDILDGKTLKEIDAVIHLEKYPKGLLFKIARGLGGIKTHSFPIAKNEIKQILLIDSMDSSGKLIFDLSDGNKIELIIKKGKIWEVKDFLNEIKFNYEIEKIKNPSISILEQQIKDAKKARANKDMLYGALWCIGGIIVTFVTFSAASRGGIYVVAWGAILFGAIQFIMGFVNSRKQ